MPGVISTGSFAKLLKPGVERVYGMKYNEYPVQYTDIFDVVPNSEAFVEDLGMVGLGLAQIVPEGRGLPFDTMSQGFVERYMHAQYALGFIITKAMYDDGIGEFQSIKKAGQLAFSMRQTKEIVAANVLNNGFSGSYLLGDGVCLFSASHPKKSGGVYSNILSTAADLSEAALEQADIDIGDFTNDKGLKIYAKAVKLIIPNALKFDAARILLNTEFRPDNANRDINAIIKTGSYSGGFSVNNFLTDANNWFVKTDVPNGMTLYEREKDNFDSYDDWDTRNAKFGAWMRFSVGCTDKMGVFGSNPA